jgi:hypothetical protein
LTISNEDAKRLYSESGRMLGLPCQTQIAMDSVITHLVCATHNIKEKCFEIVLGLNNPEPSAHVRHQAEQGNLTCVWQGVEMQQGPEFYPDDNETDLQHWEVDKYDSYLTFYVEIM